MTNPARAEFVSLMTQEYVATNKRLGVLGRLLSSLGVDVRLLGPNPIPRAKRGHKIKRRFTTIAALHPETVNGLAPDHQAIVEGRTLFPSTVVDPLDSPRVLVSGEQNRKLGDRIVKGPWKGMPLFHLTLEERATCSITCFLWRQCYGNGMQMARRHAVDPATFDDEGNVTKIAGQHLMDTIERELSVLALEHEAGFVIRLHTLGDFFSFEYVDFWRRMLDRFAALRVYGYTARPRGEEIGEALWDLSQSRWDRFAIRWSSSRPGPQRSTTIFRKPDGPVVPEGIVCPAETGKTDCCGTCGLCWNAAAKDKTIVFVAHGPHFKHADGHTKQLRQRGPGSRRNALSRIIEAIPAIHAKGKRATAQAMGEETGLHPMTCSRALVDAEKAGKVERIGRGRTSDWKVAGEVLPAPTRNSLPASTIPIYARLPVDTGQKLAHRVPTIDQLFNSTDWGADEKLPPGIQRRCDRCPSLFHPKVLSDVNCGCARRSA